MNNKFIDGGAFVGEGVNDFAGGTLPFESRVPDSNWNKQEYLPTGEKQIGINGDKLNCVTQSNHNSIEFQLNQMIADKTIPIGNLQWLCSKGYLDSLGKVNFSEKYNSILNKTSEYKGNWLYKVANDTRENGLILQTMLPEKVGENWDTYYNKGQVTQDMLNLGKEFLEWFDISYEWIYDKSYINLVKQLQHTPFQIVFSNHAVVEIRNREELMDYYDSYEPYVKEKLQSLMRSCMKLIVKPISRMPDAIYIIKDANSLTTGIWYGAKSEQELVAKAKEAGFPIPLTPAGTLDWEAFIQGTLKINNCNNNSMGIIKNIFKKEEKPVVEPVVEPEPVEEPVVNDVPSFL